MDMGGEYLDVSPYRSTGGGAMDEAGYDGSGFFDFVNRNEDSLIKLAGDYLVNNPYKIESMKLNMLGEAGYAVEGERGVIPSRSVAGVSGISPMVLILGAGLLFFALKD